MNFNDFKGILGMFREFYGIVRVLKESWESQGLLGNFKEFSKISSNFNEILVGFLR